MRGYEKQLLPVGVVLKAVDLLRSEKRQRFWGPVSAKLLEHWPMPGFRCEKREIPRPDGTKMRVLILNGKKRGQKTAGVLWLHGGGYSVAAPETAALSFARKLVKNRSTVVVAPDYTLSVTKPFPAALEDAYTAYLWLKENRASLGIDDRKIIVGGESAGGGLTVGLCAYLRDQKDDGVGAMLPLYPMLDDRETASSRDNHAPAWNTPSNRAAWNIYLDGKAGTDGVSPYAAPARLTNAAGLPPAATIVGTREPFYDETLTFFDRLNKAGVPVFLREYEGAFHAFDMMAPYAKISRQAVAFLLDAFDRFTAEYIRTEPLKNKKNV